MWAGQDLIGDLTLHFLYVAGKFCEEGTLEHCHCREGTVDSRQARGVLCYSETSLEKQGAPTVVPWLEAFSQQAPGHEFKS